MPAELQDLQARQQGALIKLFAGDPAMHFELWLHRGRARRAQAPLRDPQPAPAGVRRRRAGVPQARALGDSIEAEPWDKGWTRVYVTRPLPRLGPDEQARLATGFAELIETLEPIRREAIEAIQARQP